MSKFFFVIIKVMKLVKYEKDQKKINLKNGVIVQRSNSSIQSRNPIQNPPSSLSSYSMRFFSASLRLSWKLDRFLTKNFDLHIGRLATKTLTPFIGVYEKEFGTKFGPVNYVLHAELHIIWIIILNLRNS